MFYGKLWQTLHGKLFMAHLWRYFLWQYFYRKMLIMCHKRCTSQNNVQFMKKFAARAFWTFSHLSMAFCVHFMVWGTFLNGVCVSLGINEAIRLSRDGDFTFFIRQLA